MKKLLLVLVALCTFLLANPILLWQNTVGDSLGDEGHGITFDGTNIWVAGFITVGNPYFSDTYLGQINPDNGEIIWDTIKGGGLINEDRYQSLGLALNNDLWAVGRVTNGDWNFLISCWRDRTEIHHLELGNRDMPEQGWGVCPLSDGGCLAIGSGPTFAPILSTGLWLIRLDVNAVELWTVHLDTINVNHGYDAVVVNDKIYVVGDFQGKANPSPWEGLLVCFDMDGNLQWVTTPGFAGDDGLSSIVFDERDSLLVCCGYTNYLHYADGWVAKFDLQGNNIATEIYGGNEYNRLNTIMLYGDGYIVSGSKDFPYDGWILKLRRDLTVDWEFTCGAGGSISDEIADITTIGNDIAFVGTSGMSGHGQDVWFGRLTEQVGINENRDKPGNSITTGFSNSNPVPYWFDVIGRKVNYKLMSGVFFQLDNGKITKRIVVR